MGYGHPDSGGGRTSHPFCALKVTLTEKLGIRPIGTAEEGLAACLGASPTKNLPLPDSRPHKAAG